ncbi:hypothetical protein AgCh_017495 [Apium graveolens]
MSKLQVQVESGQSLNCMIVTLKNGNEIKSRYVREHRDWYFRCSIQTSKDYRFYAISAEFPEFSNKEQTLVFQFLVKHEQKLDYGGGYMKLHEDWDDKEFIPDHEDRKPEDDDDISKEIQDDDAKKPEDWDDEEDGEWTPPTIPKPEYKGPWTPKKIKSPAYKGKWKAPMIDNPDDRQRFMPTFEDMQSGTPLAYPASERSSIRDFDLKKKIMWQNKRPAPDRDTGIIKSIYSGGSQSREPGQRGGWL